MPKSQDVAELETPRYLLPRDAAAILAVTTATLATWADAGLIETLRLPSGHRRYLESSVLALARREGCNS